MLIELHQLRHQLTVPDQTHPEVGQRLLRLAGASEADRADLVDQKARDWSKMASDETLNGSAGLQLVRRVSTTRFSFSPSRKVKRVVWNDLCLLFHLAL